MAIQMRRGLYDNFDPTKMLPGEWAVSIDTDTNKRIIWMCFAPGSTKRIGTYEDLNADVQEMFEPYITELENGVASASNSASTATTKATDAAESATYAANSASSANTSAVDSANSATESESYAIGGTGTRSGEDTDNAKYYKEQAQAAVSGLTNALIYMGTVAFADIPTSGLQTGYVYNISDNFTTDSRFKEGAGKEYQAGTDIARTNDGYWDVLGGDTSGFLKKDGDTLNNVVSFTEASSVSNINTGEKHSVIFGKIKAWITSVTNSIGHIWTRIGKNILPYTLSTLKSLNTSGTWADTSATVSTYVYYGVTFTVSHNNGVISSITLNGTATDIIFFNLSSSLALSGTYILSGCPSGGSLSTYYLSAAGYSDTGSGVTFTSAGSTTVRIIINPSAVLSSKTFYPLIRYADVADSTYEAYCPSVPEVYSIANALNTNANTLKSVTSSTGTVTGGYIQIGRIVIVSIQVVLTAAITASSTVIAGGLPSSGSNPVYAALSGLPISGGTGSFIPYVNAGNIRSQTALSSGATIAITGVYISAA